MLGDFTIKILLIYPYDFSSIVMPELDSYLH